jgi:CRP/FNR family transcriptional regulator, anaerobic regulatory protein
MRTCSAVRAPPAHREADARRLAPSRIFTVQAGEALFKPGDPRQVYRVESGALSHFMTWTDGRKQVIDFAFVGDLIGVGHLATHESSAHAMVETTVSALTAEEVAEAAAANDLYALKLSAAGEREFDYLRDKARPAKPLAPVYRMAHYLAGLTRVNARGGQARDFIADENCGPVIADMLQMDQAAMASALLSLQKKGLLAPADGGVRILDVDALEAFADAA